MKNRLTALILTLVFVAAVFAGCAVAAAERNNDTQKENVATVTEAPAAPAEEVLLDVEAAKAIALAHAGVSADEAEGLRAEFDVDDGVKEYEIEFRVGDYEYEYTVNAETGKIIHSSKEHDPVETKPAATEAPATEAPAEVPAETEAKKEEAPAKESSSDKKTTTSSNKSSDLIGKSKAKSIALNHAGFSSSEVTGLRCEYEVDDGVKEYEVDFRKGDYEYDYTIHAVTGKIRAHDKEYDPVKPKETQPKETEPKATEAPSELIGKSKAKSIALKHAGFSSSEVTGLRCEYEVDDGVKEYEVDFRKGDYEYEYTIHAVTGKIRAHDKEYDPVKPKETQPKETEPKATEAPSELIGKSKAKSIALKHAGFSSSQVKGLECEYDVDDGVKKYEVSFRKGNYEYDYEINAITGKIISWDKEYDD